MTQKSIHEEADKISAVKLSNRQDYGEYVTFTALSSNGVDEYTVTLNNAGEAKGCTCTGRIYHDTKCRHMRAAEFEMAWTAPVTPGELVAKEQEMLAVAEQVAPALVGETFVADLAAHIVDDLTAQPTIERKTFRRENTRLGATEGFSLLA